MKTTKLAFTPLKTKQRFSRNGKTVWKTVTLHVEKHLAIGLDLQKELRTSMAIWAWYVQLKEQAHAKLKQAEHDAEELYDELYAQLRPLEPKATETALKSKIRNTSRWKKLASKRLLWQYRYRMLDAYCTALRERNDNLRTLESSERSGRVGKYQ